MRERARMGRRVGLRDRLKLTMMLLRRMQRSQFGRIKDLRRRVYASASKVDRDRSADATHHDGAVSIRRRQ